MSTEATLRGYKLNPNWWYLYGEAYDFSPFVEKHPGGIHAIEQGIGRDCTALFESYHTNLPSLDFIKSYKVTKNDTTYPLKINQTSFTFKDNGFYRELKKRAKQYFKKTGQHTKGNLADITFAFINLACFFIFLKLSCTGDRFGMAFYAIGLGISKSLLVVRSTHLASHYSLSQYPKFNRFIYWLNMCCAGDTPAQWTSKHVIAHHIDTNITPNDDDTMYPIKRILPSFDRYWYHEYQHIYIWLLYAFVYYPWTLSHNIKVILALFSEDRLISEGAVLVRHLHLFDWIETISCIMLHHITRLLPWICLNTWFDAIVIAFLIELSASLWFSLQFAVNHEMPEAVQKSGNDKTIFGETRDWGAHQVVTSHNYSLGYPYVLQLSGGLNYQIEHHLFPSVHFKHYPALSKIVRKLCKKYNLQYNNSKTFFGGVISHYELLKKAGKYDKWD